MSDTSHPAITDSESIPYAAAVRAAETLHFNDPGQSRPWSMLTEQAREAGVRRARASNLDKAIRARLQSVRVHMGEHRNAQFDDGVDPLFNDAGELGAAVLAVLDLHEPLDVHDMEAEGEPPPVVERSCRECSEEDYVQALECGDRVAWGDGVDWPCATVNAIATSLGVSGEDRSEPTPAPSEPRQYDRDEPTGVAKVRDRLGRVWTRNDRNGFWYEHGCAPQTWPELWSQLRPLTEVVSPDTTGDHR